jgi:hypothetical protein
VTRRASRALRRLAGQGDLDWLVLGAKPAGTDGSGELIPSRTATTAEPQLVDVASAVGLLL